MDALTFALMMATTGARGISGSIVAGSSSGFVGYGRGGWPSGVSMGSLSGYSDGAFGRIEGIAYYAAYSGSLVQLTTPTAVAPALTSITIAGGTYSLALEFSDSDGERYAWLAFIAATLSNGVTYPWSMK